MFLQIMLTLRVFTISSNNFYNNTKPSALLDQKRFSRLKPQRGYNFSLLRYNFCLLHYNFFLPRYNFSLLRNNFGFIRASEAWL